MLLIALKYVLWVAPRVGQVLLAGLMVKRGQFRQYPIFLAYTVIQLLRFAALFCIHLLGNREMYRRAYMGAELLDAALAFCAIYELYGHLFRTYSGVRRLAGMVFRCAAVVLLALAVVSAATSPAPDNSRILAGLFTLDRGVNIVTGGLLLLLFVFSSYFALRWEHFAFGIAVGFALDSSVALVAFTLHTYWGLLGKLVLSLIAAAAYNCSVVIWLAYLLSPEAAAPGAKLPVPSELEGWNEALLELLHQ